MKEKKRRKRFVSGGRRSFPAQIFFCDFFCFLWGNAEMSSAVLLGRDIFCFFKASDKQGGAAVAHGLADFLDLHGGCHQQVFGGLDSPGSQVGDGGLAEKVGKFSGNTEFVDMEALFQQIQGIGVLVFFIQGMPNFQQVGGAVSAAFMFLKMGQGFGQQTGGEEKLV